MTSDMESARLFSAAAEDYDRLGVDFFAPVAGRVVELAGLMPGEDVVDVGAGRGAVTFPAARAVGEAGSVIGLDVAEGMAQATRDEAAEIGLDNVELRVVDAVDPGLPAASADAVLGSMSLFLMPDPGAVIAALARLLRPRGRAVFSLPVFGKPDGLWPTGTEPMQRLLRDDPMLAELMAAVRWSEEAGVLQDIAAAAGLPEAEVLDETATVTAPSPEALVAWTRTTGARRVWEMLDAAQARRLEQELLAEAQELRTPQGDYRHTGPIRYLRARR